MRTYVGKLNGEEHYEDTLDITPNPDKNYVKTADKAVLAGTCLGIGLSYFLPDKIMKHEHRLYIASYVTTATAAYILMFRDLIKDCNKPPMKKELMEENKIEEETDDY